MAAAGQRRPSVRAIATSPVSLLLLIVVSFGSPAAASVAADGGGAPTWTTALQQHVAFFDSNNDGIISYFEAEAGLRAIGLGAAKARELAATVTCVLGPKTRPDNATAWPFGVYIENIHRGMHGSDTGSYDAQGRFVQAKFDAIFTKHAKARPDALNETELEEMRRANRADDDNQGWEASKSEFDMLYGLAKDKDGFLHKDTARAIYDGSLFFALANKS